MARFDVAPGSERPGARRRAAPPGQAVGDGARRDLPRAAALIALQRSAGNRAVVNFLQRAPEPSGGPTPEGLSDPAMGTLDELLDEFTDEELELAAVEELGADADPADEGASEPPPATTPAIQRSMATPAPARRPMIQRGKITKQISSSTTPDMGVVTRLEKKTSKQARLVRYSQWLAKRKKHRKAGYRKYAAIRHQNLMHDTIDEDLVLLIRLKRRAKLNRARDRHYAAIEAKANKKGQTPQNRTELLGEAVAAIRMEQYLGVGAKLLVGFASGPGIDQLWLDDANKEYVVIEAKGPGAKLKVDKFAVRGATGGPLVQMSQPWVANRIPQLASAYQGVLDDLLARCGLKVAGGNLVRDKSIKNPTHQVRGMVVTTFWTAQGVPTSSLSKNVLYTF